MKELDPIIHERNRFAILLIVMREKKVDFNTLKRELGLTDGNLATHLRKLEDEGIISVEKTFVGRKPRTYYTLTEEGKRRLLNYIQTLEELLKTIKDYGI